MNLGLSLLSVAGGLTGLWFAGDCVISTAKNLATRYRLTTAFVGFVLLALAANIPELAVAIMAALHGAGQVSAGDIIGANFSDVALVIGFTLAFARPITLRPDETRELLRTLIIASCIMIAVLVVGELVPLHGYCLLLCYLVFVVWSWLDQDRQAEDQAADNYAATHSLLGSCKLWGSFLGSIGLVLGSSAVVVQGALGITVACGMKLELVGATILALGTTLPEITIGINALRRQEYALALGPTLGTIIAQATLALGSLAVLSPAPINLRSLGDSACFMFMAFVLLTCALLSNRMGRTTGFALLSLFGCYIAYHLGMHFNFIAG